MDSTVLRAIKKDFPNCYDKKFNYFINLSDMYQVSRIINNYVFNNKIDLSIVDINTVLPNGKNRGRFYVGLNDNKIQIHVNLVYSKFGDNFSHIVSVLCHELIHVYDYLFGEMKKHINPNGTIDVLNINYNQYVGSQRYNAHGDFFKKLCNKFNDFGILVKISYAENDRRFFKMLKEDVSSDIEESTYCFFDDPDIMLNETDESVDNPEYKKRLESAFGSIDGGDPEFVYVDEKNWYFAIS